MMGGPSPERSNAMGVPSFERTFSMVASSNQSLSEVTPAARRTLLPLVTGFPRPHPASPDSQRQTFLRRHTESYINLLSVVGVCPGAARGSPLYRARHSTTGKDTLLLYVGD